MTDSLYPTEEALIRRLISGKIPIEYKYEKEDFLKYTEYIAEFLYHTGLGKPKISIGEDRDYIVNLVWRVPGFVFSINYSAVHYYGGFDSIVFNRNDNATIDRASSIYFSDKVKFNSDFVRILIEEYVTAKHKADRINEVSV